MQSKDNRGRLAGNRLVLGGTLLYLLEWVAILGAGAEGPFGASVPAEDVVAGYAGNAGALAFMAGWFSIVLTGRVLFVIGIRASLADSGPHPLLDFAVAAMAIGVVLEIVAYAIAAGAAQLVDTEGALVGVLALDRAAMMLNLTVVGPSAVAVLFTVAVMWRCGAFPLVLNLIGVVGGVAILIAGVLVAPTYAQIYNLLTFGVLLMWVWMIWSGILVWRRIDRDEPTDLVPPTAPTHGAVG